jgi:catechol 2,3-dioxygenase-like lactoylglutathione lyase family enzyme
VPSRGIHHVDIAVSDPQRSLAFYLDLLGPLGWFERVRYPSYRGTEEVIYLEVPASSAAGAQPAAEGDRTMLGIRQADGGEYRYYAPGVEHIAFEVDEPSEVDDAHARCVESGANVHFPPEEDRDIKGYYALFVFDPDGIRIEVFSWDRRAATGSSAAS